MTARIDLSLVGSYSPAGFEYGVCATTFSGRSLKWIQICIKSNAVDIFLLWIWSCMHFLEIVFCDCSMFCLCGHGVAFILWRLCFLIVPIQAWGFAAQVCASGFFYPVASWLSPGRSTRSIGMQHVPLIKAL